MVTRCCDFCKEEIVEDEKRAELRVKIIPALGIVDEQASSRTRPVDLCCDCIGRLFEQIPALKGNHE